MALNVISQGTLMIDLGVNNRPIFAPNVSKEALTGLLNYLRVCFKTISFSEQWAI